MKNNQVELIEVKILILEMNSLLGLNNWKACWETNWKRHLRKISRMHPRMGKNWKMLQDGIGKSNIW